MSSIRVFSLTLVAMLAFAGNSLLCRLALKNTGIDAAGFTAVRLVSGAVMLWLLVMLAGKKNAGKGNWLSALALFVYAAGFSFAYLHLTAATGALLLFAAVQVTMMAYGAWKGERFRLLQLAGMALAFAGLLVLLMPGLSAPSPSGCLLMIAAGIAWGIYSLRGRNGGDAIAVTSGNFMRSIPFVLALAAFFLPIAKFDEAGLLYAVCSGALASGLGYAVWYSALPALRAGTAATVQLSVPLIAAVGGIVLLGESISLRLALAACAILGGIALVVFRKNA